MEGQKYTTVEYSIGQGISDQEKITNIPQKRSPGDSSRSSIVIFIGNRTKDGIEIAVAGFGEFVELFHHCFIGNPGSEFLVAYAVESDGCHVVGDEDLTKVEHLEHCRRCIVAHTVTW